MSFDDKLTGIREEIEFWQSRLTDLHSIRFQTQRKEFRMIIDVLTRSKSAYLHQFVQVQREIEVKFRRHSIEMKTFVFQEFTIYVEDCLKFLKILAEPSSQLNDISLEQFDRLIIEIFYRILVTWHHSRFFASLERIKLIISKVCYVVDFCSLNVFDEDQQSNHQSMRSFDQCQTTFSRFCRFDTEKSSPFGRIHRCLSGKNVSRKTS